MEHLSVIVEGWSAEAATDLEAAMAHDTQYGLDGLRRDVMAGKVILLGVYERGQRAGTLCLRLDVFNHGVDGVLVAQGGRLQCGMAHKLLVPPMEALLMAGGASRMRIHTTRAGAVRSLEHQGFKQDHIVMVKDLL